MQVKRLRPRRTAGRVLSQVKRWRDGQMALRWCAAGMIEAGKQFRRVNSHLHLPTLRAALQREIAEPVGPVLHNDEVSAA
jgi:hypothetical protein